MSANQKPKNEAILNSDIPPTFYDKVGDDLLMDLENLIRVVILRYKLLKDVESLSQKKLIKDIYNKIPKELSWDNKDSINNDIASHFLLALIMCKSESDSRWFISKESLLYKARLEQSKKFDMYKILSILGMKLNLFEKNKIQR